MSLQKMQEPAVCMLRQNKTGMEQQQLSYRADPKAMYTTMTKSHLLHQPTQTKTVRGIYQGTGSRPLRFWRKI